MTNQQEQNAPVADFSGLSERNLDKIKMTVDDIDEKFQLNGLATQEIEMFPLSSYYKDTKSRRQSLEYLKIKGVVRRYQMFFPEELGTNSSVEIEMDVAQFQSFRNDLKTFVDKRSKPILSESKPGNHQQSLVRKPVGTKENLPVYEIKYTEAAEIILNNFLFSKLDYDGENHLVFEYVFRNPNREITREEIEESLRDTDITKPLPKIVDNWGFTGDIRKVFFQVSKQSIKFRNPIHQKDLDALHLSRLRFPKK